MARAWSVLVPVALGVALALAFAGCNQSLFDAHGKPGGGSGDDTPEPDGSVPDSCPSPCLGDAAAAFEGSPDGADNHWRYLDDLRNRTWTAMTASGSAMVGKTDNRLERCTGAALGPACAELPGALLVTTTSASSAADPAIEYTAARGVVQLALRVRVPSGGANHLVRLYRNSREDVLFTAPVAPGAPVDRAITVDALAGDRFLVALEPTTEQRGTAALQFFVSDTRTSFPATCRLALGFSDSDIDIGRATIADRCGGSAFTAFFQTSPMPPLRIDGPFAFHGKALHLEPDFYVRGSAPLATGDRTIQFWVMNEAPADLSTVFSDIDEQTGGGVRIGFDGLSGPKLVAGVVSMTATPPGTASYAIQQVDYPPGSNVWHFVRIVLAGGNATFCLDGTRVSTLPLKLSSAAARVPYLGRNNVAPLPSELTGDVDDLRIFSGALPCNE